VAGTAPADTGPAGTTGSDLTVLAHRADRMSYKNFRDLATPALPDHHLTLEPGRIQRPQVGRF
jgi:hypothetical protein